jgi:hypothetical protein
LSNCVGDVLRVIDDIVNFGYDIPLEEVALLQIYNKLEEPVESDDLEHDYTRLARALAFQVYKYD